VNLPCVVATVVLTQIHIFIGEVSEQTSDISVCLKTTSTQTHLLPVMALPIMLTETV